MNVYEYRAALYCEPCADKVKRRIAPKFGFRRLKSSGVPNPPWLTSHHWPQGPYPGGGGEADTPQHCDSCSVFLENSLTRHGHSYVEREVAFAVGFNVPAENDPEVLAWTATTRQWSSFYGIAN